MYVSETPAGYEAKISVRLRGQGDENGEHNMLLFVEHTCSCEFECYEDHRYCDNNYTGDCEDYCDCEMYEECDCDFDCEDDEHQKATTVELTPAMRAELIALLLQESLDKPEPSRTNLLR